MHEHHQDIYDVVIAGAGPVGLFLACELRLFKLSVLVLERAETPHAPLKRLPFGMRGLSAPTLETLDRRGLLDEVIEAARADPIADKTATIPHWMQQPRRPAGHFAGIEFHHGDIDTSKWPYRLSGSADTSMAVAVETLETVLARRAGATGCEIRRGLSADAFHESDGAVTVHAGGNTFRGRWLVGCDGGRSAIRKAGCFDFVGTGPEFTGYSVEVDIAEPDTLPPRPTLHIDGHVHLCAARHDCDGGIRRRSVSPPSPRHTGACAGGAAPRVRHRNHADPAQAGFHVDGSRLPGNDLSERTRAARGRCRAHPLPFGRSRAQSWTRRRNEPRLEAGSHHPWRCAGRSARQLSTRAASDRGTRSRLVACASRTYATYPRHARAGSDRSRSHRDPGWRNVFRRARLGCVASLRSWQPSSAGGPQRTRFRTGRRNEGRPPVARRAGTPAGLRFRRIASRACEPLARAPRLCLSRRQGSVRYASYIGASRRDRRVGMRSRSRP